jgi:hypothetical protein
MMLADDARELAPRPEDPTLDSRARDVELGGDLVVGELVHRTQHERAPLPVRQCAERRCQVRVDDVVHGIHGDVFERERVEQLVAAGSRRRPRGADVARDREQPRALGKGPLPAIQSPERPQERGLNDLLRVVGADVPAAIGAERRRVPPVEQLDGVRRVVVV